MQLTARIERGEKKHLNYKKIYRNSFLACVGASEGFQDKLAMDQFKGAQLYLSFHTEVSG